MKVVSLLLLLATMAHAAPRLFRDTEGRKIAAEILDAGPDWVKLKRVDGRVFLLNPDRLQAEDKAAVEQWRQQRDAAAAQAKREAENREKLVAFCRANSGKAVGNGVCWTLADEAFRACGLRRPGREPRVWGRLLDLKKEQPLPGDIIEFRHARFPDAITGPEHTAIIIATRSKGRILIAEQNWNDIKRVTEREMDPAALISGELMFYRPL